MKHKKHIYFSLMLVIALIAFSGCSKPEESTPVEPVEPTTVNATEEPMEAASELKEFTLDELAQFNGENGNPAYVAVDGIVYDVTNVPAWKNGMHNGNTAGQDLTDVIMNQSPHGPKVLEKLDVVGKIVE